MILRYIHIWFAPLLIFLSIQVVGQDKFYREGVQFFDKGHYREAVESFNADRSAKRNKDLMMKRVIANYHINDLAAAKKDVPDLLAYDKIPDELFLYIAKIFHAELNFSKAVEFYKEYMKRTGENDPLRSMVIDEIKRCAIGMGQEHFEQIAFVENMGPKINTPFEETDPVQSPNFLFKYYFSSNRPGSEGGLRNSKGLKDNEFGFYYLDMYTASLEDGNWTDASPLNTLLNTSKHERVLDFNTDGNILIFMKGGEQDNGTIYVDTFGVQNNEIYPPKLNGPLYGEKGDVYMHMFNDSTIVFSSKRSGGYGGYDLYVSYLSKNTWSQPINLGPSVNSAYDEITPFITSDGMTLYFSSNSTKSVGGFDVFKSTFSFEYKSWSRPESLLLGINSSGDDTHYRISADGQSGYFRSTRKTGYGQGDLYFAYLKEQELGQLAYSPTLPFLLSNEFIKGIADVNSNVPQMENSMSSTTSISKKNNTRNDNVKIREFIIEPLYYGSDENLFTIQNDNNIKNILDIMQIYPTVNVEFDCHSIKESQVAYELYFTIKRAEKIADYLIENGVAKERIYIRGMGSNYPLVASNSTFEQSNSLALKLNRRIEVQFYNTENLALSISYNNPVVVDNLKDMAYENYNFKKEGLSYKIQIASVKQMLQNQILNYYPDSMIEKNYNDEDYKYTIGLYKNYFDAQSVLKILRSDNFPNAFIVPYLNGKRIPSEEITKYAKELPDLVNYLQYNGQ